MGQGLVGVTGEGNHSIAWSIREFRRRRSFRRDNKIAFFFINDHIRTTISFFLGGTPDYLLDDFVAVTSLCPTSCFQMAGI
jgi:hypothetical protein